MQSHTSDLDKTVHDLRANTEHKFEIVMVDGVSKMYCSRCGKAKDVCALPEVPWFIPCRGFI